MIAKVIAGLVGLLAVASLVFTIVSFRKPRPIKWWVLLLSIVFAMIVMPVTLLISGVPQAWTAGLVLGSVGSVLGVLWGFAVKIHWENGAPTGRNSVLWLVFFLLSFGFTYTLMLFAPTTLVTLGALASSLPTGMGVGTNLNVLIRVLAKSGATKQAVTA
jgi:hypothetical protein